MTAFITIALLATAITLAFALGRHERARNRHIERRLNAGLHH